MLLVVYTLCNDIKPDYLTAFSTPASSPLNLPGITETHRDVTQYTDRSVNCG